MMPWVRSVALCAAVTACAPESQTVESLLVVPGYYETLDCRELIMHVQNSTARVRELSKLIERSAGSGSGPMVNVLAYDTDYAKAQATLRNATEAATHKGCDLTPKTDAKAPAAPELKPARHEPPKVSH
jgi:outer membrane protein TolC